MTFRLKNERHCFVSEVGWIMSEKKVVLSEEADNDEDEDEGWKIWKVVRL